MKNKMMIGNILLTLAILGLGIGTACEKTPTTEPKTVKYEDWDFDNPSFSDNFDGNALNVANWTSASMPALTVLGTPAVVSNSVAFNTLAGGGMQIVSVKTTWDQVVGYFSNSKRQH